MHNKLWDLFLTFLKVNLLTSSGPASAGLLYAEVVGKLLTREEFIEAVGYSSVLPGSDALQLAMFIGYRVGGIPGALIACLGAVLPPTVIMLAIAALLTRLRGEAWISGFVKGLAPALAALLLITVFQLLNEGQGQFWPFVILGVTSLLALVVFKVPPTIVVLAAGLIGILWFR
ncbi:MAG TPA: chromate transporter [Anaerolineae bacterium]|nr:chromate transporter [Anaerolineae bacterium]HQK14423.1 chromate transporter [Anaerolineae bacterium]